MKGANNPIVTANSHDTLVKNLEGKIVAVIGNIGQMTHQLPGR